MITRTEPACQAKHSPKNRHTLAHPNNETWQAALATIVRDPEELFKLLELNPKELPAAFTAAKDFALRVPRSFVQRMKKGDWNDPLLLQVLPTKQELETKPGFLLDPLAETHSNPHPGLIHKYQGRVLLIISTGCAINCRYCFRRHFPYDQNNPSQAQWQDALTYIKSNPDIKEVIFSGGDPLAASDKLLARLVNAIAEIPHITTLRVHSRLPVVIPERITPECIRWLTSSHLQPVLVIHTNHANELNHHTQQALLNLKSAGVTLLNQTVLLRGINDNKQALAQLSKKLFQSGVLPYYLHLLDKVQGAAHFEINEDEARQLVAALLLRLPGYLVPKLVREQPGAGSKTPIFPYLTV